MIFIKQNSILINKILTYNKHGFAWMVTIYIKGTEYTVKCN